MLLLRDNRVRSSPRGGALLGIIRVDMRRSSPIILTALSIHYMTTSPFTIYPSLVADLRVHVCVCARVHCDSHARELVALSPPQDAAEPHSPGPLVLASL